MIAYIALALALGGGTVYAANKIKVGSKQIKRNAVKAKHIAADAVGASELNEGDAGMIRSARIGIEDPTTDASAFTKATLLQRGPFTITAECRDLGSYASRVFIASSEPAHGLGTLDSSDPDDIGATPKQLSPGVGSPNAGAVNVSSIYASTASGRFINVAVYEINKPQGPSGPDCVYQIIGDGN